VFPNGKNDIAMPASFSPYWASLGKDGGTLPGDIRYIDTPSTEAFYLGRGWGLNRVARPYYVAPLGTQRAGDSLRLTSDAITLRKSVFACGRPAQWWLEQCQHPELEKAAWPELHRKKRGPRWRGKREGAEALANHFLKTLRLYYGAAELSVGRRKPSRETRPARQALARMLLCVDEQKIVDRKLLAAATGLTTMQISRLVAAARHEQDPRIAQMVADALRHRAEQDWRPFRTDWRSFIQPQYSRLMVSANARERPGPPVAGGELGMGLAAPSRPPEVELLIQLARARQAAPGELHQLASNPEGEMTPQTQERIATALERLVAVAEAWRPTDQTVSTIVEDFITSSLGRDPDGSPPDRLS
jgi:hypothetical protein